MDKEIKIIVGVIVILIFAVIALVLVKGENTPQKVVVDMEEKKDTKIFVDSSKWRVYVSEEYAYEIQYPLTWEFNLTDGTTFNPLVCTYNKYDECVGRISVAVFSENDEDGVREDLQKQCSNAKQVQLRNINSPVWMCETTMSTDFFAANGYNDKREYYFSDNRGHIFEIDVMYITGEDLDIEEEIIQTIKLTATHI